MKAIHTEFAPAAIGTYSQATQVGAMVFISGQIGLDPQSMELVTGDIYAEINQVLLNLRAVCQAAGGDLANLVKINIYLTDLNHFSKINEMMTRYFRQPYPARAVVEVSALPRGAKIEIDGILMVPESC